MTTTKTPTRLEIDSDSATARLQELCEKLDSGDEVTLDFSHFVRIDPGTLHALEGLAKAAEEKSAKLTLRGMNVEVYKVLKLARLDSRFSFES